MVALVGQEGLIGLTIELAPPDERGHGWRGHDGIHSYIDLEMHNRIMG